MTDLWWRYLLALLFWPGLAGGAVLCWFYLWMGRKLTARLQGRQGPPFYQPFFDFLKLLGKKTIVPRGVNPVMFYGLPLLALVSIVFALALLPVPGSLVPSFAGDLILMLYLMEMPAFCTILAGYASRSLYGQVSASREAVLLLGYNLPFLASVIALAILAKSFQLEVIARQPFSVVHVIAALTFLLSVPGRLRTNPFSIPNAEQEILAGSMTEYNGLPLALFELAHGLELVTMVGLFTVLFIPGLGGLLGFLIYLLIGIILVALVTLLAVVTGRIQINLAFRFFWWWGALAALASFAAAILLRS